MVEKRSDSSDESKPLLNYANAGLSSSINDDLNTSYDTMPNDAWHRDTKHNGTVRDDAVPRVTSKSNFNKTCPATEAHEKSNEKAVQIFPFFLLNIINLLMKCSGRFHHPLVDQYMYKFYAGPLLGNHSHHNTARLVNSPYTY